MSSLRHMSQGKLPHLSETELASCSNFLRSIPQRPAPDRARHLFLSMRFLPTAGRLSVLVAAAELWERSPRGLPFGRTVSLTNYPLAAIHKAMPPPFLTAAGSL